MGLQYPINVPCVMMRLVPTTLGIGLVPIALHTLDCSASTSLLGFEMVSLPNEDISSSTVYSSSSRVFLPFFWCIFCNEDHAHSGGRPESGPLSRHWWTYLSLTGLNLGAVVSCKCVGLFTIAMIGVSTLKQLWILLGDLDVSRTIWVRRVSLLFLYSNSDL